MAIPKPAHSFKHVCILESLINYAPYHNTQTNLIDPLWIQESGEN